MHHRLDAPLEFGAQRDDVAPVTLGDDGFLQHGRGLAVGDVLLQPGHHAVVRDLLFTADTAQLGRGRIKHIAAFGEHARDRVHQTVGVGQANGNLCQVWEGVILVGRLSLLGFFCCFALIGSESTRAGSLLSVFPSNDFFNSRQATRVDLISSKACGSSTPPRAARSAAGTDIMRATDGQVTGGEQEARLGRLRQQARSFVKVGGGFERMRQFFRSGEIAEIRQAGQDLGVFEHVKGFGVHCERINHRSKQMYTYLRIKRRRRRPTQVVCGLLSPRAPGPRQQCPRC